jgi:hypothetical protein
VKSSLIKKLNLFYLIDKEDAHQVDGGTGGGNEEAGITLDDFLKCNKK